MIRTYIEIVEHQANNIKEDFVQNGQTQIFEDEDGNDDYPVTVHGGLDSETWDLQDVFEERLPNLQRRGALITLCSFLEHELDNLCQLLIREENLTISLKDINGKGVKRAIRFLRKVVGVPINNGSSTWQEIDNILEVRNRVVHGDGRLTAHNQNNNAELNSYIKKSKYLSGETEIIILEGYLLHVLEVFDCWFQEIDKLIAMRAAV